MDKDYIIAQINENELKSISELEQKFNQEYNANIVLIAYEKSK
ncbi:hypothetical protein RBG61_09460 [Paludicola sp. MB14-C6]|nr:hypothetical protein [Paludicola sp. MB14-C6]WMJ22214.1 hypothetical protein RBG61_09460 [Paludicola sp. MB14-C6]